MKTANPKRRSSASQRKKKAADLPRRALSGYNLFFRDERAKVMEENRKEGVSRSGTFGALGRTVAERWKKLSPEELEHYHKLAAEDKKRYKLEMDTYKANALGVHKERIEQRRLAGELPMAADGITFYAETPVPGVGASLLSQANQTTNSSAQAASRSLDSLSLLNLRDQLALSSGFGAQDPSRMLLSQLMEARLAGHAQAQLPLFGAGAGSSSAFGFRLPQTSMLDQQLALAALEAEQGRQLEQQATQQMLQNAIANQQLQLAMAQQASLSSSVASARPSYLSNMQLLMGGGHGQQQQPSFLQNAAHDYVMGSVARDHSSSLQLNQQLGMLLQQAQQNRDAASGSGGSPGSPKF